MYGLVLIISSILFIYLGMIKYMNANFISDISLGIYYFIFVSYVQKYGDEHMEQIIIYLGGLTTIITIILAIINSYLSSININLFPISKLYYRYSFNQAIIGISLFFLFKNLTISNSKIVNYIASSTFAVYLVSEHPLMRRRIWNNYFKLSYADKKIIPIICIFFLFLFNCN